MRYVIYGAGAIGCSVGAKLHMNGIEVVLIARGAHLKALQTDGLTLIHPEGTEKLKIPAAGHPTEIDWRPDDVVVLAMKSQDTQAALEQLRLCRHRAENPRGGHRLLRGRRHRLGADAGNGDTPGPR
jgi:2-dehydropantoate 2-reductase